MYAYDELSRLVSVTDSKVVIKYTYDSYCRAGRVFFILKQIVVKDLVERMSALEWEIEYSLKLWEEGNSMSIHKRQKPWGN